MTRYATSMPEFLGTVGSKFDLFHAIAVPFQILCCQLACTP